MSDTHLQATWRDLTTAGLPPARIVQERVPGAQPWVMRNRPEGQNMLTAPPTMGASYLSECMRAGLLEPRLVQVAAVAQNPSAGYLFPDDFARGRMILCVPCATGQVQDSPLDYTQRGMRRPPVNQCLALAGGMARTVFTTGGPQATFAMFLLILLDGNMTTVATTTRGYRERGKVTVRALSMLVDWVQAGLPLETQHFANEPTLGIAHGVAIARFVGAAKTYVRDAPINPASIGVVGRGCEWFRLLCLSLRGQACQHVVTWGHWLQAWALEAVAEGPNTNRRGPGLTQGVTGW